MEIKWLKRALKNLENEANYIARENPQAACQVVKNINRAVIQLANNPALGHPGRVPGVRELVVPDTRYLVPYRVRPKLQRIEILRVFHCSRKPLTKW